MVKQNTRKIVNHNAYYWPTFQWVIGNPGLDFTLVACIFCERFRYELTLIAFDFNKSSQNLARYWYPYWTFVNELLYIGLAYVFLIVIYSYCDYFLLCTSIRLCCVQNFFCKDQRCFNCLWTSFFFLLNSKMQPLSLSGQVFTLLQFYLC